MNIIHYMKKENSGLARSTLEIAAYEEKLGHGTCIKEPTGDVIYGMNRDIDIECIHSQLPIETYFDGKPKIMWQHGEPLSSVGNGVSMKAICDLAPKIDALICMRKEEWPIWNSIKRTYLVPKGVDLETFKPIKGATIDRLPGEPAILYVENWRGQRNPLYLCVAMEEVIKKYPKAKLHLFNCKDGKMKDTFQALMKQTKWWTFISTLQGPVDNINELYNKSDMVVSCLYPLYARGIEAFGAGKAFISAGYTEHNYPFQCRHEPASIARAIVSCWENYDKVNYRKWAEDFHDVKETVKQSVAVYERYM